MSTRQSGNRAENEVMVMAEALGYATFAARGSRGPVDVLCFEDAGALAEHGLVPLAIQVGDRRKVVDRVLNELSAAPRPIGSLCLVARRHRHKTSRRISWTWHSASGKFDSLAAALEGK